MMKASRTAALGLALAGLAAVGTAQGNVMPVDGPVTRYIYDVATGTLTLKDQQPGDADVVSYANVTAVGSYYQVPVGQGTMDWGVKATGLTGTINSFDFGYATQTLDPTAGGPGALIRIRLYTGTTGNCAGGDPGTQVFSMAFTGMPGSPDGVVSPAYIITVMLPTPITIPDGPLGWLYGYGDGVTGPLLIMVGADGTGTIDNIDIYNANVVCQFTTMFTTPGIASFYLALTEDDGAIGASVTPRNGIGVNPMDYSTITLPHLGSQWDSLVSNAPALGATLVAIGFGPTPPPPTTTPFPFGTGELLISLAPFPILDVVSGSPPSGTHSIGIPNDPMLTGVMLFAQAVKVEVIPGVDIIATPLNALDLVLGP